MVDVKFFGACGDGRTDDTMAIQKAFDEAAKTQDTALIPRGIYSCGELKLPPYISVQGQGTWDFRESHGTILRLNSAKARCLLNITGAYGTALSGLCLDGGGLMGEWPIHGIMADKKEYGPKEDTPRIDTCRVERFSGDGIRLERIWCFSVRHSHSIHNGGCGLRLRGWDGFILDNWLSGNMEAGFGAYDENAACTITGNRIEWNHRCGIIIIGGNHFNITGNYIDRSGRCGIAILGCDRQKSHTISAVGNVMYRSGKPDWGIDEPDESAHARIEQSAGIVFTGNAMNAARDDGENGEWSPDFGIVLRGLENSVIKDNVMHEGALKQLVVDHGGHGGGVIVEHNVGSLKKL